MLDGATLRLADNTVVRLAGVEAPTRPLTLGKGSPWPPADVAREELDRIVKGRPIRLAFVSVEPDRYGRRHAYAFLPDGSSLQATMVAGGSVRARWFPGEGVCLARFAAAERVARLGRIGLWGEPEYAIRSSNDLSLGDRNGLYALVEGRVVTVGHGTRMIFLDFGRNFRRDFTVMVAPEVADLLKAEGRDPDAFAGRRVIVRGTIEESGGPAIRLNDPAEIEWIGDGPEDAGAQH